MGEKGRGSKVIEGAVGAWEPRGNQGFLLGRGAVKAGMGVGKVGWVRGTLAREETEMYGGVWEGGAGSRQRELCASRCPEGPRPAFQSQRESSVLGSSGALFTVAPEKRSCAAP